MFNLNNNGEGLFKGVLMAYLILVLHVILIAAIGFLMLVFGGIISHMVWVLIVGFLVISASGYYFYNRLKDRGKLIGDTLYTSPFRGRPVEVSFLNGFASLKLGKSKNNALMEGGGSHERKQLEDLTANRIRELNQLTKLLKGGHISNEEFCLLKQQLLRP